MMACLDVHYAGGTATTACLLFNNWLDAAPVSEFTSSLSPVADYEPGNFYRRELPCLLAALNSLQTLPEIIVIDAYVWLDTTGRPGLGAHLYETLNRKAAIIGVAKSHFAGAPASVLLRGMSQQPLYISAVGIPESEAVSHIRNMHGPFRIPTLLKRVDRLCR